MEKIAQLSEHQRSFLTGGWLVLVLTYLIFKGILPGWNNTAADFNNYYVSSVLLTEGKAVEKFYDNDWYAQQAKEKGIQSGAKFAPFPPVTSLLYLPLVTLEPDTARRVWLCFNCFLLIILPFRLKKLTDLSLRKMVLIPGLFAVPIASALNFGQAYLFLCWLILESLLFLRQNKPCLATGILAVCTLLKYFPLLFLLYFIPKKQALFPLNNGFWQKANLQWLFSFFAISSGILLVTYLIYPDAWQSYLLTFSDHLEGDLSGQGKYAVAFQSIDSLLNNLFVFHPVQNTAPLLNAPVMKSILKLAFIALIGGISFLLFKRNHYKIGPELSSIMIIGAFGLVPASASYHFLFLIIPVCFIFKWLLESHAHIHLLPVALLLLITFFIQHHHIPAIKALGHFDLILHYPRLWSLLFLFGYLSYINYSPKDG